MSGSRLFFQGADTLRGEPPSPTRSFVLVSRGCEVIHVPKTRFKELSDGATITELLKREREYPSDGDLCRRFLAKVQWESYKRTVVDGVLESQQNRLPFEETLRKPTRDVLGSETESSLASMTGLFKNSSQRFALRTRPHTAFVRRQESRSRGILGFLYEGPRSKDHLFLWLRCAHVGLDLKPPSFSHSCLLDQINLCYTNTRLTIDFL